MKQIQLPSGWTKAAKERPCEFFGVLIHRLTIAARDAYPQVRRMPDTNRVEWLTKVNEHVHQLSGAMITENLSLRFLGWQIRDALESRALTVQDVKIAIRVSRE